MSALDVRTFGCRLNAFESEVIRGHAVKAGLENTIIFNTCTVTGEARRQARQAIRRARREQPEARIVVTGCAVQVEPDVFAAMEEVDMVLGNVEKTRAGTYAALDRAPRVQVTDIMGVQTEKCQLIGGFEGRARAFVQVQNGCDHRCTFCIIPYGRGNSRSLPVRDVVHQVQILVDNGYHEVVLTGVDLTSFGPDLDGALNLGALVSNILDRVPDLPLLRLSSMDPSEIDAELFERITGDERLAPHIHLSVQSGDDLVLKRMKRRHLADDIRGIVRRIRDARSEVIFGADLIAGFPTESDAAHRRTLALVKELEIPFLHVFPYSEREGTPAAKMPAVPVPVRRRRAAELRALATRIEARLYGRLVGSDLNVLAESFDRDMWEGRAANYARVRFSGSADAGHLVPVRVTGQSESCLEGLLIS